MALRMCIGSTAWLPLPDARFMALCRTSCALIVKLLMFISYSPFIFVFYPFFQESSKMAARERFVKK